MSQKDAAKIGFAAKKTNNHHWNFHIRSWETQEIDFFSAPCLPRSLLSYKSYRWLVCALCIFILMLVQWLGKEPYKERAWYTIAALCAEEAFVKESTYASRCCFWNKIRIWIWCRVHWSNLHLFHSILWAHVSISSLYFYWFQIWKSI